METIAISKFKAMCLEMLSRVQMTGRPLLVTKRGRPIAQIIPPDPVNSTRNWFGSERETCEIVGDIVTPLGPDHWDVYKNG